MGHHPDRAEALLAEAVEHQPQSPFLRFRLARRLLARGDPERQDKAARLLRSATAISPGEPKFLKALIEHLFARSDHRAARAAFEHACLLAPNRIDIWEAHAALSTAANRPLRVYSLHQMFFLNPMDSNVAATLAENHRLSGNLAARRARALTSGLDLPGLPNPPPPMAAPAPHPLPPPQPAPPPAAAAPGLWHRGRSALGRRLMRKWPGLRNPLDTLSRE